MIDTTLAIALSMPFFLALVSTIVVCRATNHIVIFFIFAMFAFLTLQTFAFAPLNDFFLSSHASAEVIIRNAAKAYFFADGIAAIAGGLLVWRLHVALK